MLEEVSYPGGKAGSGTFQKLINLMPPHQVYIEPFLGDAALMRAKRPAALNIGLDLDPDSPGLAWLATLVGNSAARSRSAAAGIVNGGVPRRRKPDNTEAGGGVLPGTASLSAARGPGASARLARVDRIDRVSPGLAIPAGNAGNGDAGSARRSPSPLGGNGDAADYRFGCLDGIEFLRCYPFTGQELVYCDPPYLMSTRAGRRLYKHEMSGDQHWQLLQVIRWLPCMVIISGYHSVLYADQLQRWNSIHFEAMTRGGRTATEWVWFNFPEPLVLHDDRYLGEGFRKREQLKRKKLRWIKKLRAMPLLDRQALLSAIASIDE